MPVGFDQIGSMSLEDLTRPPVLPEGEYVAQVTDTPVRDRCNGKAQPEQYDTIEFTFRINEYVGGASTEALQAYGEVAGAKVRRRFLFDRTDDQKAKNSGYYFGLFLKSLGVDSGRPLAQLLEDTVGRKCIISVGHRPNPKEPDYPYTEVEKTVPLT